MKKFLAFILVIVCFCVTSIFAFAAPKNVSLSDYPSLESMLSQFDQGDGNYLLPYSFEKSDNLSSFLKYYNDDTGKYIKLFSYNSSSPDYISFYFVPKTWSNKSLVSGYGTKLNAHGSSSCTHYYLYISGSSTTQTPFILFQFKFNSDKNVFVNTSSIYSPLNDVTLYCQRSSIVSFLPDDLTSLLSISSYARHLSDVSSISFIDSAEYVPPVTGNTLTINYLYAEDRPAADSVTQTIHAGTEYNIPSPEIEGYTPSISVVSGTMPEEDLTVDVYYSKTFYPLIVKYQYTDGTEAAPEITYQYPAGFSYDIPSPQIPGSQADKPQVSGEMPAEALTETVTYTRIPYTLTIRYQYTDGTQAAEPHQQQLYRGDHYSVPSPEITGYHPNQSAVTGIMPAEDVISTVTYRKDSGGSVGPAEGGPDEGGGDDKDPGGEGDPGKDPFIPTLPPSPNYDPFIVPTFPPYTGNDPFVVGAPPLFSGYDPFVVLQPPPFIGYDPFSMSDQ